MSEAFPNRFEGKPRPSSRRWSTGKSARAVWRASDEPLHLRAARSASLSRRNSVHVAARRASFVDVASREALSALASAAGMCTVTCASRRNATSPRTPHAPRASANALGGSSSRSSGNARASRGSAPASTSRRSWLGSRSGRPGEAGRAAPRRRARAPPDVHASQNARIARPSARACDQETPRTVAGAAAPPSLVSRTAHNAPSFSQHRMCRGRKRLDGVTLFWAEGGPARRRSSSVVAGSSRTSNATPAFGWSRSTSSESVAPRLARTRALPASAGYFTSVAAREARTASGSSRRSNPKAQYTTSPRMHRAESRGESGRRSETR